jgi:hypothetical protein
MVRRMLQNEALSSMYREIPITCPILPTTAPTPEERNLS